MAIARESGDPSACATVLSNMAGISREEADLEAARGFLARAEVLLADSDDLLVRARVRNQQGLTASIACNQEEALARFEYQPSGKVWC